MSKAPRQGPVGRAAASTRPPAAVPEVVDPVWLLKAFAVMVGIALVCGYLTLCWMFYRGQWQLVLHPSRGSQAPATVGGVGFQQVRFGAGPTGEPQLTGWWMPAPAGSDLAAVTVLYLPSGDGSLIREQATLANLHDVGVSVFAMDYRGYGQSSEHRPNQASMTEDATSAWTYLTGSRSLRAESIVPYGRGVGGALALGLAIERNAPAVVLDEPDFTVRDRVGRDPRAWLLPVRLLFHDRFALEPALGETGVPKLILSRGGREDPAALGAHDPKMTVALPAAGTAAYVEAVRRFLGQYASPAHGPLPLLTPRARKPE